MQEYTYFSNSGNNWRVGTTATGTFVIDRLIAGVWTNVFTLST
jgi:hypothetical protein